jgi:hypothetical protein
MPVGIMTITTATPPLPQTLHDNPLAFHDYVADVIGRVEGVDLIGLFFDIGAEKAYVVVENLDDFSDVKAVSRILGAESFVKMVRAADAAAAVRRESGYRGSAS